jgi:integrase
VASYAVGKGYIKDRILEELRAPLELKAKFRQLNREEGRPAILDLEILGAVLHKDISSEGSWQVKAAHRCCAMTFVRSGVVCAMRWDELDLERRVWSIPREKMKTKHRPADSPGWTQRYVDIPLSTQMVALLKGLPRHGDYVFPSLRHGSDCLGQNSLEKHLNQVLGLANQHSPHSYRSTFSTWANEQSTPELNRLYERESIELALDHAVKGLVEKLYDRSRTLERIRPCVQGFSDALEAAENRAASIHRASQDALRAIDSASAAGQVLH